MDRRQVRIRESQHTNGTYSIIVENTGLRYDVLCKIKNIIQYFSSGSEFYFGHYKVDGVNISHKEFLLIDKEMDLFFNEIGERIQILELQNGGTLAPNELTVCRVPNDYRIYELMPKMFHYYLETTFFCPKISWDTFVNAYKCYTINGTTDYVINGYTDYLFAYVDSGDFIVSFDPRTQNPHAVRKTIETFIFE
jgi:hypothetical protein